MLDPKTNSNRRQSSTFMETLQDKLKDIKNFSNWSAKEQMVAVTAVGVIFGALLPVVAVALPVAATGAAVALTLFFAVKAVKYGYKGLKWSAEKTWEGAKYTAGKIKAGAVYVKDLVKEAASSLEQATREGTSSALKKIGEGVQNLGRKMSERGASISDLDSIPYSTEPQEPQGVVLLAKRKLDPDLIDSNRDLERGSLQSNSLSRSSSMDSLNSASSTVGLLTGERKEVKTTSSFKSKVSSLFRGNKVPKEAKEATKVKYQVLPGPDGAMPYATVGPTRLGRNSFSSLYNGPPKLKKVDLPKVPKGQDTSLEDKGSMKERMEQHKLDYLSSPDDLRKASAELQKQGYFGGQGGRGSSMQRGKPDYVINGDDRRPKDFGYYSDSSSGRSSPVFSTSRKRKLDVSPDDLSEARRKLRKTGSSNKPLEQPSTRVFSQKSNQVNPKEVWV